MLRSNTRKAADNIRAYILNNYNPTNYDNAPEADDFRTVAAFILETFMEEKGRRERGNTQALFVDWCAGLPSIIDTCYYYNRSAVNDLGEILEETEAERARFTEPQAEEMLSRLIYRELTRAAR